MTPFYQYDLGAHDDRKVSSKFLPVDITYNKESKQFHFRSGDPTMGWFRDIWINKDFRDKSITNPDGNPIDQAEANKNRAMYALRNSVGNVVPIKMLHDIYLSSETGQDYYGRNRDISTTLLSRIIKIQSWNDSDYKKEIIKFFENKDYEIDAKNSEISALERGLDKKYEDVYGMDISLEKKQKLMDDYTKEFIRLVNEKEEDIIRINQEKIDWAEEIKFKGFENE